MSAIVEIPVLARQERETVPGAPGVGSRGSGISHLPFALAIFVSAFLLFQVQLLLGKEILPLFGGAPAVWTVCVFVFQLLFLAGYGYSHGLAAWLPVRRQVIVHGVLLGVSAIIWRSWRLYPIHADWLRRELGTRSPGRPHMGDHGISDRRDWSAFLLAVGHEST